MSTIVMLDAAYPPDAATLINDMESVGAEGAFVYVWGPIVKWTPLHVQALRRAGKQVAPIIVPGNLPNSIMQMMRECYLYGFIDGPVFFDFEWGSLPSNEWWLNARYSFNQGGFHADRYGTTNTLGKYSPGAEDWIASWLRAGKLDPIPTLPPTWNAWQFVDDVSINAHIYDVSVVNDDMWTPNAPQPPATKRYPLEKEMEFVKWNNTQQLFVQELNGDVWQHWTTGDEQWQSYCVVMACVPGTMLARVWEDQSQLHVFAMKLDGTIAHYWQNAGEAAWNSETVG